MTLDETSFSARCLYEVLNMVCDTAAYYFTTACPGSQKLLFKSLHVFNASSQRVSSNMNASQPDQR